MESVGTGRLCSVDRTFLGAPSISRYPQLAERGACRSIPGEAVSSTQVWEKPVRSIIGLGPT